MKKILLAFGAIAALLSVSCSKTDTGLSPMVETTVKITATRPSVSGAAALSWPKKDTLGAYDGATLRPFVCPVAGVTTTFQGKTSPADPFYAIYPYSKPVNFKNGTMNNIVIPAVQVAVKGGFNPASNPCVAKTTKESETSAKADLKYVGAFVSFEFTSKKAVKTIALSSASLNDIAGTVKVAFNEMEPVASAVQNLSKTATLASDGNISAGKYFIAAIPGTYSKGLSLTFTFSDGSSKSESLLSSGAQLTAGQVCSLGKIDVDNAFEDDPDDTSADKTVSVTYDGKEYTMELKKLREMGHPRLFMTADDFTKLNERLAKKDASDLVYLFHKGIISMAESELTKAAPAQLEVVGGKRALTQARNCLKTLSSCAYAYKTTGEKKYLDKCAEFLKAMASFTSWNSELHFLDPSEFALGAAIAYDWLYYDLDYETRSKTRKALIEYDINPFLGYSVTESNNWNQVCNGGALAAATVVYEKSKEVSAAAFGKLVPSNRSAVKKMYGTTGNGIEGYGYWEYAMMYQVVILQALETAFGHCCGLDTSDGLKKTADWMLYMDGPSGPFNFSDSAGETSSDSAPMIWLAAKYDKPGSMVREKMFINPSTGGYSANRCLPLYTVIALFKHPFSNPGATSLSDKTFPTEKIWSSSDESPLVLARLGWNFDGTDRYVGFKCAGAYNNHSHMDAGSFVFQSMGQRWTTDIPMGSYTNYEQKLKDSESSGGLFGKAQNAAGWNLICRSSHFHNTLSFMKNNGTVTNKINCTDQITNLNPVEKGIAPTVYNSDAAGYGGMANLSPFFADAASSVKRTVKLVGDELHVIDEISALSNLDAEFEWRIVTRASVEVSSDNYITLSLGGKTMYLKTSVTSGSAKTAPQFGKIDNIVRPTYWSSEPAAGWDACQSYNGFHVALFSSSVAKGTTATYTTIFTPVKP